MNKDKRDQLIALVGMGSIDNEETAYCPCGCGTETCWNFKHVFASPKFKPGHDAKLVSRCLKLARQRSQASINNEPTDGMANILELMELLENEGYASLAHKLSKLYHRF